MRLWRGLIRWLRPLQSQGRTRSGRDGPPGWVKPPVLISRLESDDGRRVLEIGRQPNGFYRFVEWTEQPGYEYVDPYLAPTRWSGLYASAEDAERDARMELSWLRPLDSS